MMNDGPPNIVLTGFMGAGKSRAGAALAKAMGRVHVDMDAVIEARVGCTIPEVFESRGEAYFRGLEAALALELSQERGLVISTGGGTLLNPRSRDALGRSGVMINLRARAETLRGRLGQATASNPRPLLRDPSILETLLKERQPIYDAIPCQLTTDALSPQGVADAILAHWPLQAGLSMSKIQTHLLPKASDLPAAKEALLTALKGLNTEGEEGWIRLEVPCGAASPLDWFEARPAPRFLWQGREDGLTLATAGVAESLRDHPPTNGAPHPPWAQALGSAPPRLRLFTWRPFGDPPPGDTPSNPQWGIFKQPGLILPQVEVGVDARGPWMALNLKWWRGDGAQARQRARSTLQATAPKMPPTDAPTSQDPQPWQPIPDFAAWYRAISTAKEAFAAGHLRKVVFARALSQGGHTPKRAWAIFKHIATADAHTFRFFWQPEAHLAFFGASPERLYHREGRRLRTEALAGTRPRHPNPKEDQALKNDLLSAKKDRHEQRLVAEAIAAHLLPIAEAIDPSSEVSVKQWSRVQHLFTPIAATLKLGVGDGDITTALHPTPAVGGLPRQEALALIQAHEAYDRGLYAAPIGWISANAAEMTVAIRSARLKGDVLTLFSGAGIVPGSEAEGEWAEIDTKVSGLKVAISAIASTATSPAPKGDPGET